MFEINLDVIVCADCEDEIEESDVIEVESVDGKYCADCASNNGIVACEECYEYENETEVIVDSNGDSYCSDCSDTELFHCDSCEEWHHNDILINTGCMDVVCEMCVDDHYFFCESCEDVYHEDYQNINRDEVYECDECYSNNASIIRDYGDNPRVEFYGEPVRERYYGVELEVDSHSATFDDGESFAESVQEERIYFMEDGSLDNGVEVITHPLSLAEHVETSLWESVTSGAKQYGFESHDIGTCGIHVHINREAFTDNSHIMRLVYIIERHWNNFVKFSRRTHGQLSRWADSYVSDSEREMLSVSSVERMIDYDRYYAVNLTPRNTVELRFFRGTLKVNTIHATIQMVEALMDITEETSSDDIVALTWGDLVTNYFSKYTELNQYLGERELLAEDIEEEEPVTMEQIQERERDVIIEAIEYRHQDDDDFGIDLIPMSGDIYELEMDAEDEDTYPRFGFRSGMQVEVIGVVTSETDSSARSSNLGMVQVRHRDGTSVGYVLVTMLKPIVDEEETEDEVMSIEEAEQLPVYITSELPNGNLEGLIEGNAVTYYGDISSAVYSEYMTYLPGEILTIDDNSRSLYAGGTGVALRNNHTQVQIKLYGTGEQIWITKRDVRPVIVEGNHVRIRVPQHTSTTMDRSSVNNSEIGVVESDDDRLHSRLMGLNYTQTVSVRFSSYGSGWGGASEELIVVDSTGEPILDVDYIIDSVSITADRLGNTVNVGDNVRIVSNPNEQGIHSVSIGDVGTISQLYDGSLGETHVMVKFPIDDSGLAGTFSVKLSTLEKVGEHVLGVEVEEEIEEVIVEEEVEDVEEETPRNVDSIDLGQAVNIGAMGIVRDWFEENKESITRYIISDMLSQYNLFDTHSSQSQAVESLASIHGLSDDVLFRHFVSLINGDTVWSTSVVRVGMA